MISACKSVRVGRRGCYTSAVGIQLREQACYDALRLIVELLGLCILRTGHGLIRRAHCREGVGVGMRRWCRRATGSQALRQSLSRARRETVRSRIATSGAVHDAGWGKTSRGREVMDGKLDGTKGVGLEMARVDVLFAALLGREPLTARCPCPNTPAEHPHWSDWRV